MGARPALTERDRNAADSFANFLSWNEKPWRNGDVPSPPLDAVRPVPPAWWAYALGHTTHCPPKGEM